MIPVSICIITKNEEKFLGNCLRAIRDSFHIPGLPSPVPHEIVVTDTGSTDRTREIAEKYADKVVDYPWDNNFSHAKNFCAGQASNDFIISIDSDEYIVNADWISIDRLLTKNPKSVGKITIDNDQTVDGMNIPFRSKIQRLFPRPYFHFEGNVHEQLRPSEKYLRELSPGASLETAVRLMFDTAIDLPLQVRHVGYVGDKDYIDAKCRRDLALLKDSLQNNPSSAYTHFQIGQCYHLLGNDSEAAVYFEKALSLNPDTRMDYAKVLVCSYGYCLLNLERFQDALTMEGLYGDYESNADFIILMGLIYTCNQLYLKALAQFVKALSLPDDRSFSQAGSRELAHYYMGYIYELLGEKDMAVTQYQLCHSYPAARDRLNLIKKGTD